MPTLHSQEFAFNSLTTINDYTREDAFEDGVLVDVADVAREAGFRAPIALSEAAWRDCVAWDSQDNARKGLGDSEDDRLWDVLQAAAEAVKLAHHRRHYGTTILASVWRVPRPGVWRAAKQVDLKVEMGFEAGEMVGTIYLASEE
jgi:hypothetical protein